jgi:hypothetical protein
MKKISAIQTSDGRLWAPEQEAEAKAHEASLIKASHYSAFHDKMREIGAINPKSSVIEILWNNATVLVPLLMPAVGHPAGATPLPPKAPAKKAAKKVATPAAKKVAKPATAPKPAAKKAAVKKSGALGWPKGKPRGPKKGAPAADTDTPPLPFPPASPPSPPASETPPPPPILGEQPPPPPTL